MQTDTEERIKVFYREAFARKKLLVAGFVLISVAMMLVGLNWPKQYESSTTILIEEQNIIEPLMRGAAVSSDVSDRALNARELIFSRAILMQVLEDGGYLEDNPSPVEVEGMMEGLRGSTTITQVGRNLIRITHEGDDPERVYRTTEKFASLFLDEMVGSKSEESDAAYAFIDKQVKQYEEILQQSEAELHALRTRNPDARPGAREEVTERISSLQSRIDDLEQRIREAQITEASLQEQLSGEVEGSAAFSRSQRIRERIAQLESELDTLRLSYHDTYPDVVHLQSQIEDLERALAQEEQRDQQRSADDPAVRSNPVYQDLQAQLYETRTAIRTMRSSMEDAQQRLAAAQERARQMEDVEAELAKLMRDHEVNRGIYEDLQLRRENARVSMNLSRDQQGLNIRIYEPAAFAHSPSGPTVGQFVMAGFALGAILPLGLLFAFLLVDPRVRTSSALTEGLDLQLLGVVPHLASPREARQERRGLIISGLVVVLTVAAVIGFLLLR